MPKDGSDLLRAREAIGDVLHGAACSGWAVREIAMCWSRYGRPGREEWPERWKSPQERRVPLNPMVRLPVHEGQDEASAPVIPTVWTEVLGYWSEAFPGWRGATERALAALQPPGVRRALGDGLWRSVGASLVRMLDAFERLGAHGEAVALSKGQAGLPRGWEHAVSVLRRAYDVLRATGPTGDAPRARARRQPRARWLAESLLLVRDCPHLSDAEIARRVGACPSSLCRSREYRTAARLARAPRAAGDGFDPLRRVSRQSAEESDYDEMLDL